MVDWIPHSSYIITYWSQEYEEGIRDPFVHARYPVNSFHVAVRAPLEIISAICSYPTTGDNVFSTSQGFYYWRGVLILSPSPWTRLPSPFSPGNHQSRAMQICVGSVEVWPTIVKYSPGEHSTSREQDHPVEFTPRYQSDMSCPTPPCHPWNGLTYISVGREDREAQSTGRAISYRSSSLSAIFSSVGSPSPLASSPLRTSCTPCFPSKPPQHRTGRA